ncbi:MAG: radical SAM protein [Planctomycetota bacterium]
MKLKTLVHISKDFLDLAAARHARSRAKAYRLRTLNLSVTYKCDSRCTTCGIWKFYQDRPEDLKRELTLQDFETLFRDPMIRSVQRITISGGEPFLREDLEEIVAMAQVFTEVRAFGTITNGLRPRRIADTVGAILDRGIFLGVDVSLDGIGAAHDEVRGRPGNFEKVCETLDSIEPMARAHGTPVGVGLTVTPGRVEQIGKVRAFAEERGIGFTWRVASTSPYYGEGRIAPFDSEENAAIRRELQTEVTSAGDNKQKRLLFENMEQFLNDPARQVQPCFSGFASVWVDPYGDVFPCIMRTDRTLGNIKRASFESIWMDRAFGAVRKDIRDQGCACWTECEANPTLRLAKPEIVVGELVDKVKSKIGGSKP